MAKSLTFIETMRSILGLIAFSVIFTIALPLIFILVVLSFGKATDWIIENLAPAIAKPVLWVIGIKFSKVHHGKPFSGPAVYVINHSSTLDILTMMATGIPGIRFVAKWELQYFPFFFVAGRLTGQVFIKRQKSEKAIKTLVNTYKRLKKNNLSIMVAPEGTRKHEGIIGPFKKGAFRMAVDLGYPMVPIYFEGNNELSLGGSIMAKSGEVKAHIHPPIDTSSWSLETLPDHIEEVRAMYLEWAGIKQPDSESYLSR